MTKKLRKALVRPLKKADLKLLLEFRNRLIMEEALINSSEIMNLKSEDRYINESLNLVRKKQKIHLIVEIDGEIAGSCEIRCGKERQKHTGEIGISIDKVFRDEGIGFELMKIIIAQARKLKLKTLYLHCFEINKPARNLYEKIGFKLAGVIPQIYNYRNEYIGDAIYFLKI